MPTITVYVIVKTDGSDIKDIIGVAGSVGGAKAMAVRDHGKEMTWEESGDDLVGNRAAFQSSYLVHPFKMRLFYTTEEV